VRHGSGAAPSIQAVPSLSPFDNPLRGIALTASACAVFAVADVTSKFLSAGLPIIEIQWIRYVLFLGMAIVLTARTPGRPWRPRNPKLQIVRGLCVTSSSVLFVYGIREMTMAQATTISFLSPLLITVLSIPLLGEVVGIRRWGAVLAGMVGMLIVVRPGTAGFQPAALFGVASSCSWALALIITRKIARTDAPQTTLLWSSLVGAVVLTILLPFDAAWPTWWQFGLCLMLGVLSSVGQWMVVLAHRLAPASLLAPISYTQLPWVTIGGYLVFDNLPDQWTLVGASVIIASGLYTAHREQVRAREARQRLMRR
jgi:drug/metabolite transporter (DMT)-like permease